MSTSFLRRYWRSLTDLGGPRLAPPAPRAWRGHTFPHRYWAGLLGIDLRDRTGARVDLSGGVTTPEETSRPFHGAPATGSPDARWFVLPRLPEPAGLLAAGDDAVVAEAVSPDGRAEFHVRRRDAAEADYALDVTLRDFDELPAVITVRYERAGGSEQELLLPMTRQDIVPTTGQIELPGFTGDGAWWASAPVVLVSVMGGWDAASVAASVAAAVNEATRDSWRRVRDLLPEDLGRVVDEAMP
ncbi:hypothetical protein ACQPZZ_18060 [Microbispora sp. CA-135349]|uniref:hypothetical protein n=1 Tax=Microbispora sp. CA-135349 TaxID=3239953 RepID=UPI003D8C9FCA